MFHDKIVFPDGLLVVSKKMEINNKQSNKQTNKKLLVFEHNSRFWLDDRNPNLKINVFFFFKKTEEKEFKF